MLTSSSSGSSSERISPPATVASGLAAPSVTFASNSLRDLGGALDDRAALRVAGRDRVLVRPAEAEQRREQQHDHDDRQRDPGRDQERALVDALGELAAGDELDRRVHLTASRNSSASVGRSTTSRTTRPARPAQLLDRAGRDQAPVLDDRDRLAEPLDELELVAGEDDGDAGGGVFGQHAATARRRRPGRAR